MQSAYFHQKRFRLSMRKFLINLLQSKTIWGYLLPNFISNISSNWIKKSLHSKIMFLFAEWSSRMLVIFLSKKRPACWLPSFVYFSSISMLLRDSWSAKDNFLLLWRSLDLDSTLFKCYIYASHIFNLLVRYYSS